MEMEIPESTRRINTKYNGSDLYDSFEFRQITHQLNTVMQASSSPAYHEMREKMMKKVVQGSSAVSSTYFFRRNSPLYRHQMNRIYKESARTPRKISGQKASDKGCSRRQARVRGFVARLWIKVKQGFLWNKGETEGIGK